MSVSKDVIKQCLISKQREVDEAVIVNRPVEFEENGNYVIVGVRHAGKSYLLTSSSCHPKFFIKEFGDFLMPCHQHGLGVNLLVQR